MIQRRPQPPALGLVDVIYVTPWVIGALVLHDVANTLTLAFIPLFVASWWQDWQSARAATSYFSGELVGFDALTAGNYIALADGWSRPVPDGAWLSTPTLISWTGVFAIYISWNLAVIRKADPPTRRAFLRFTIAELPLLAIGCTLVALQLGFDDEPGWVHPAGVGTLALAHAALLVFWRLMSQKEQ
ncbi:hypothetical protein [Streptomyces sp. 8N616]|uniref:hypothetical protein n=1 Tax=Streptomyces sp. 8N616 TaxID=3457414 RepID=UPI003FD5BD58